MNKAFADIICRILLSFLLLPLAGNLRAQDGEWLNRRIQITKTEGTRYQFLRHISDSTGYFFVYDSQVLDNDREIRIPNGEYTLRDAIYAVTGNKRLQISLAGTNHIVLRLPEQKQPAVVPALPERKDFTVYGRVYDLFSKEPLSSATVAVVDASVGTVTNRDGRFRLTLPDSLSGVTVRISHVGYESLTFSASSPSAGRSDFMLEPKIVSLQEVVVRVIDPRQAVQQMLEARQRNYSPHPLYLTAFYREGVEHKKHNVDLTEAVLKLYKTGHQQPYTADQVKLIKMRRILDKQERDTIVTKVKSGIHSALQLDLIGNPPDFLDISDDANAYLYAHTDIAVIDDRLVNVISFEQRRNLRDPFFTGELFIDTENHALVEARFQVNPKYVRKATPLFVEKRSKNHKIDLRGANYVVSYKPTADGLYVLNHVRGELEFRVRRKRQWFSSVLKVRFELVNCKADAGDVQPFPRSERFPARTVFSETDYQYDADFWDGFNVILPEDELKELILNNLSKVAALPD